MEVPSPPRRAPECDVRCAVIALGSAHHDDVGDAIGVVAVALWEGDAAAGRTGQSGADAEAEAEAEVRIALTELVQRAVENLGQQLSGDWLTGSPYDHRHQQRT